MMTQLDLFSGIGGFALACRWAGVQTIGFAEIDPYASKVLAKNFPGVPNYGDIRTIPAGISAWLVTGGFPCQPFSVAGTHAGTADDRWLWPAMFRIIASVRPHWVLAENVPGIIGLALDTVLSDLESLDYATRAITVPACAVDAPHRRERVWMVAHSASVRRTQCSALTGSDGEIAGWPGDSGAEWRRAEELARGGEDTGGLVSHPNGAGLAQREGESGDPRQEQPSIIGGGHARGRTANIWQPEPGICRMADGIPNRVDRLRGLGNAIVPQVAYELIRMMIDAEEAHL